MGLGSGIRKNIFRIPDPVVKKALDTESGSATLLLTLLGVSQLHKVVLCSQALVSIKASFCILKTEVPLAEKSVSQLRQDVDIKIISQALSCSRAGGPQVF
jgi:hypothetical protein